jgi:hypothetical protein
VKDGPANDRPEIDFIDKAEELQMKAREIARKIQERVWRVMGRHGLPGPHAPSQENAGNEEAPSEDDSSTGQSS